MSEALDRLSLQLRSAVLAGNHEVAERLVSEYADAVRQVWETLPEAGRAVSALPGTVLECLTWARGMTIVQRAIAAEQLAVLEKSVRYQPDVAQRPRSTVQVSL